MSKILISTAIPYVNAEPHIGHALEFVQADVLARHARARGHQVRAVSGTDDNSLSNVLAAQAAGVPTPTLVARNADAFQALLDPLDLAFDDFVRTSTDPRHRDTVRRIWSACAASGDLYQRDYAGDYCVSCEAFYADDELVGGRCPEHGTVPERVAERNWFFRLSRYTDQLLDVLTSGRLRVEPPERRNEVLSFVRRGLRDFSVSRSARRAHGWGIPVPGDPDQVIYVWFDALVYYLTASLPDGWWPAASRRHVIGKGILRFHAVYWPAILLSAGLPVPDLIAVHDYLTVAGAKIAKSAGNGPDPAALVRRYGVDAVRWWLVSEVPRIGDTDFTVARLVARHDVDLAGGLGNLVSRVATLLGRSDRAPRAEPDRFAAELRAATAARIDSALTRFEPRAATDAIRAAVTAANRYVEHTRPWRADAPDVALATLADICGWLATEVAPFLPAGARRLAARVAGDPRPPFRRLAVE